MNRREPSDAEERVHLQRVAVGRAGGGGIGGGESDGAGSAVVVVVVVVVVVWTLPTASAGNYYRWR